MPIIAVASTNPVKLRAAGDALARAFPDTSFDLRSVAAPSGVSDQPMSDAETEQGARQRVAGARTRCPDADYWMAFEGGVEPRGEELMAFAWAVVSDGDRQGVARSGSFFLPRAVADLVRDGMELGDADDRVFGRVDSKRDAGAIGILTGGLVDRAGLYAHAALLALAPFISPDLYGREDQSHR